MRAGTADAMAKPEFQYDWQSDFDTIPLREVLDANSHPTFVLDLDPDLAVEHLPDESAKISPIYCNEALRLHERLREAVLSGKSEEESSADNATTFDQFKAWAYSVTAHDVSKDVFPVAFVYNNLLWTGSTVRKRWRIITGNQAWREDDVKSLISGLTQPQPQSPPGATVLFEDNDRHKVHPDNVTAPSLGTTTNVTQGTTFNNTSETPSSSSHTGLSTYASSIQLSSPEKAVADWTVPNPTGILSQHLQTARSIDWAKTPLGPMEAWSREFRQLANLCMNNPHPAALFWGSELTMLYNEAYAAEVAGNKHPSLMGTGFSGPFAELWDYAGPIFAECARTGTSVRKDHDYLPIDRQGVIEETFYSWSFTPLYGGKSRILGFYNAPFDTTKEVIGHRRMRTVNRLSEFTAQSKSVKKFWEAVIKGLEDNHYDVPFALLYSVAENEEAEGSSVSSESAISSKSCYLEGYLGIPDGHPATPPRLDLKRSFDGFVPCFREAMRTREPTLLNTRDGSLPEELLKGFQWRGFGDPCRQAIIFPVRPTNGDNVQAFLILGIAPRRIFDADYEAFVRLLNRQLATLLASVMLYESEVRHHQHAAETAAIEKEYLEQQLSLQTSRMRRMTELSPLGMFLIDPAGTLLEANDQFFEMTGLERDEQTEMSWLDFVAADSLDDMKDAWDRVCKDHTVWSGEVKLKGFRQDNSLSIDGRQPERWILFTAQAETNDDDVLRSVMGSITDISHLKWVQGLQDQRLQEAERIRRSQNEFIDMTCHEMRNPLSAILQSGEDIVSTLEEYRGATSSHPQLQSCIESASTILLCAQHQKTIVDDILTISKLNSNLLLLTPTKTQLSAISKQVIKMFEPELRAKGIQITLKEGYKVGDHDWIMIDSNRVLQVLVNLLSNAIKFTAKSPRKEIAIEISTTSTVPTESDIEQFRFAPCDEEAIDDLTKGSDWGAGVKVYAKFIVHDTGCGITPEEQQIIFQRFKQVSPRTHGVYGGSGLGLFISKRLAELHGGQIGVKSQANAGTSFIFFVQARRCEAPGQSPVDDQPIPSVSKLNATWKQRQNSVASKIQSASEAKGISGRSAAVPKSSLATLAIATSSQPSPWTDTYILVVEDNLINQQVLVKQLKKIGAKVNVANDGVEALEFLKLTHFCSPEGLKLSIILMDLEMPNMGGIECVSRIRQMQKNEEIKQHVPVVAVTANAREQQMVAAREAGMDDVVSKPFLIGNLLSKISPLIRKK